MLLHGTDEPGNISHILQLRFRQVVGRAIPQALSRWLPTSVARVPSRVWSSGICGGQSGAGAGLFRVLLFPLPIFIHNQPHLSSGAGTIGQKWPQYKGLSPTLLTIKKIKLGKWVFNYIIFPAFYGILRFSTAFIRVHYLFLYLN
jgi:hypothetical protein